MTPSTAKSMLFALPGGDRGAVEVVDLVETVEGDAGFDEDAAGRAARARFVARRPGTEVASGTPRLARLRTARARSLTVGPMFAPSGNPNRSCIRYDFVGGEVCGDDGCGRGSFACRDREHAAALWGAGLGLGWDETRALLGFVIHDRQVRFVLPLPDRTNPGFTRTPTGRDRTARAAQEAYEQAVRQRWRALALVIESKLEAVETGIVDFTSEFLAHLVLPGGETVGEAVVPRVEEAYRSGQIPQLLRLRHVRSIGEPTRTGPHP